MLKKISNFFVLSGLGAKSDSSQGFCLLKQNGTSKEVPLSGFRMVEYSSQDAKEPWDTDWAESAI